MLICFTPALSPPLSLAWDKFTANHERCQINLLWIEILQGWKEHCCSFLKQVLYLYSQANRRCKKDNSLKTWLVNSPEKDKWYLIFFSLDVEPATCHWCKAVIIIFFPALANSSGFGLKHPGIPKRSNWLPQSLSERPVGWGWPSWQTSFSRRTYLKQMGAQL